MDFFQVMKLFSSGGSVWSKVAAILLIGAGIVGAIDTNKTGTDDLISGLMASAGDGLTAYDKKDYNRVGNVIDSLIAGLTSMKQFMIDSGLIKPHASAGGGGAATGDGGVPALRRATDYK